MEFSSTSGFWHSSMDQVRENKWIKEHMIGAVDLWFGALTDHNVSHCNTAHFMELEFKLDNTVGIHRRPAINRDRMFELFHDKIGDLCRQSLIESLNASLSHETLADLQEIKFAHESWLDGKLSSKNLADKVFRQMSIQKSFNRKDIIDQWNRETHSCSKWLIHLISEIPTICFDTAPWCNQAARIKCKKR